jgi:hypothetical protein
MAVTNQDKLQSIIQTHAAGQSLLEEWNHFHLSVKQKLWSADYFHDHITQLQPEVFYEQRTQGDKLVVGKSIDQERSGLYANLLLDGFLMNAMAALYTLAHEIMTLYSFRKIPRKVYIDTIKKCLVDDHPHCLITMHLSKELVKPWFTTFAMYRHCTTHESLVGSNIRFDVSLLTGDLQQAFVPLPDDPRVRPLTYKRGRELKSYCDKMRRNVRQMVRHSYYCIIHDIKRANYTLPVP